jgi:voltage-gated potassium channel
MALAHTLARFCYRLAASGNYHAFKERVRALLQDPRARWRVPFDSAMIALVVASVFIPIYDSYSSLGRFAVGFEWFAVTVFIIEYLARLWVHDDVHRIVIEHYERAELLNLPFRAAPALGAVLRAKGRYVRTPLAVIDLLAILPALRESRLLSLFLLFRLFKLFRYTRNVNQLLRVISEKRFELETLGIFLGFVVITASVAFYFFEGVTPPSQLRGFFDAVYWSLVTVFTVGYGDIVPHTPEGRLVAGALIVSGVAVVAFLTSIVIAAFAERMQELRERRTVARAQRFIGHTVICGYGRIGEVVAARLAADDEPFVIIDKYADSVRAAQARGYVAIEGDAASSELLTSVGVGTHAKRVLCLTHDDVSNVYIALSARFLNPQIEIISRANRRETIRKLKLAGANHIVMPFESIAMIAAEYIGQPVAFEAVYEIASGEHDIGLGTAAIPAGTACDGCVVGDVRFEDQRLVLFGVIRAPGALDPEHPYYTLTSQHFFFNPRPNFRLQGHDVLVVFGHAVNLDHFKQQLESGQRLTRGV